eukprot:CAMPEP_0176488172 /NCGR_PEP_ID=MMETSP0200_2-20121128/6561_1 /TAXON_ID=947934 /ORGANISM="Chaetoceros sp., Strain GSL56" /LENGTH=166 /DNA_ID=CAMNT_0017885125 /DNA_START=186 /DNA_END=686 /DNA_ORIENTATION=-
MEQILSLVSSDIIPQICDEMFKQQSNKGKSVEKRGDGKTNTETSDSSKAAENINRKRKVEKTSKSLSYIPSLDTKYLFGDTLQVTYRIIPTQNGQRAILTMNKQEEGDNQLPSFEYLRPLPKNIVMWCYPFDPLNPKQPTMDKTDGFPRMEFIPLSSLFKDSSKYD